MRYIAKQTEPKEFTEWKKKNKGATYKNVNPEIKLFIKKRLLAEQFFLCCYCEKQIEIENSTIEHLQTIDNKPKEQLNYSNFLASCNSQHHCNQKRGNKSLQINPLQKNIANNFSFYLSFSGKNLVIKMNGDEETINILNLNDNQLARKRGKSYFGIKNIISNENVQEMIDKLSLPDENGKLQEFVSAITQVLKCNEL